MFVIQHSRSYFFKIRRNLFLQRMGNVIIFKTFDSTRLVGSLGMRMLMNKDSSCNSHGTQFISNRS